MMGIFGPFVEVKEYKPGTIIPDKSRMAAKTTELLSTGAPIICEAAFMDEAGNYCAVDILRWNEDRHCYDMYEVKNAPEVSEQFIKDAAYQAYLIRKTGLKLDRVHIIYHGDEPYDMMDVTEKVNAYATWVDDNIGRLGAVKSQEEEVLCHTGVQCFEPYECWYYGYCRSVEERREDRILVRAVHIDEGKGTEQEYGSEVTSEI